MIENRDRRSAVGSGKDAQTIGIDALQFLAGDPDLLNRFLDVSGFRADEIRAAAGEPGFFIGLLDFVLAHEPTVLDFAAAAGLDPSEIGAARDKLAIAAGHNSSAAETNGW